ncbi:MAG: glycosyltransferase family 39 protein [Bacteroidales bacterium]|nr:glycosyltransferase family 39 protein [Bacteroidales bacterium]MDY0198433.1 glycosyltransferase family 39 protein [Tenuifilaceae bacterium]
MKITNKLTLFLIVLVAIALRFYNYQNIPFTHDEFSALSRTNFNSFSELIDQGVKVDGHPAGIQVFLYYWTKLAGKSEVWVKLPFMLMGIASVVLVYLIAKMWYNETVALLSTSFVASIQFSIVYSQIARPYISGLFFSMLMAYFWSRIVLKPTKRYYANAAMFVISAALCAYNHHFSLLFAVIVGVSGLFLVRKEFLVKYVICGLLIFILYVPHLSIFFHQLSLGGVDAVRHNKNFLTGASKESQLIKCNSDGTYSRLVKQDGQFTNKELKRFATQLEGNESVLINASDGEIVVSVNFPDNLNGVKIQGFARNNLSVNSAVDPFISNEYLTFTALELNKNSTVTLIGSRWHSSPIRSIKDLFHHRPFGGWF